MTKREFIIQYVLNTAARDRFSGDGHTIKHAEEAWRLIEEKYPEEPVLTHGGWFDPKPPPLKLSDIDLDILSRAMQGNYDKGKSDE